MRPWPSRFRCRWSASTGCAQIDQPTLNQPFFAGAVTFATLMPMRAIPFRVVAC